MSCRATHYSRLCFLRVTLTLAVLVYVRGSKSVTVAVSWSAWSEVLKDKEMRDEAHDKLINEKESF